MWNVRSSGRERGLSSLLAGCSLTCRDFQKGQKIVLEKKKESMLSAPDGSVCGRIACGGIDSREEIDL